MKRKNLLFALLLAFMAPWAVNAQETVTIGNGTSGGSQTPFNSLYGYSFTEQIYPASEITIDDETVEGTITEIRFYLNQEYTDVEMVHDIVVYMKNVTKETFTSNTDYEPVTASDIVFDGQWTIPMNYTGWLSITLDTPFEYDGESNLMVAIDENTSGYKTRYFRYTSVTNSVISYYHDSYNPDPYNLDSYSGSKTVRANRADMQIVITPIATGGCNDYRPKTLVASNVTAHAVTLTWTVDNALDATANGYNVDYKKASDPDEDIYWHRNGTAYNVLTTTFYGLDPETEYQARVQAACGDDDNSDWRNAQNFTTTVACPAPTGLAVAEASITANEATATWTGTSESYVVMIGVENIVLRANFEDNAIPAAFTNSTSYPWTVTAGGANGSGYCAIPGNKGINSSNSDLTYNVTGPCTVSFMAKVSSENNYDYGRFLIDGTQKMNISGTQDWTSYSYELTEGTHTLVWRYNKDSSSASGSDLFYVDDIVISTGVSSWTEYTTTNQSYPFDNLTTNTTYQVKVKGNCGEEGYSIETEPVSFTTLVSCTAPTGLAIFEGYPTAHGVSFTWDYAAGEVYQYGLPNNMITSNPEESIFNTTWYAGEDFPYWTNLAADTDRIFWLRKKCSDTDFSEPVYITFHTLEACPAPTEFEVDEESITAHEATLTWEGTSNSYTVSYRTKAYMDGIEEGFAAAPSGWIFRTGTLNADGTATLSGTSSWSRGTSNGVFDSHMYMNLYSSKNNWLITPSMDINDGYALSFDMAYTAYSGTQAAPAPNCTTHRFVVLISTDDMATWTILREWNNNGSEDVLDNVSQTGENVSISLASYAGRTAYIAFYGHSETTDYDNNMHFDNVSIGTPVAAGEWQYVTTEETTAGLTGLVAETPYEAKLVGDCEEEGLSTEVGLITFTTDVACPAPTDLLYANLKSNQVDLTWTNGGADSWIVAYKAETDDDFTEVNVRTDEVAIDAPTGKVTYTLTGLVETTAYTVKVRDNCEANGDGISAWSATMSFTTLATCSVENVNIFNIGHYTAGVYWSGESADGFTVKYRTAAGEDALFKENFENETSFANWTFTSMNTANNIASGKAGRIADAAHTGSFGFRFSSYSSATDYNQYLVSPELTVTGELKFYAKQYGSGDDIYVGYSTTTNDLDAFEWDEEALALTTSWTEFTHELPSNVKYIAFHYYGNFKYYAYVDDITIGAYEVPAGAEQTISATELTADLTGLEAGTKYDIKVVPNCDEALASEWQSFTTVSPDQKYFITEGNWGNDANWEPTGAPTIDQTVELRANATITGEAFAKSITGTGTGEGTYTLTIANGGKLKHLNSGVTATVKKTIRGYNTNYNADTYNNGDYYLIANPLSSGYTPKTDGTDGFLVGNFDLYSWDYTQVDNEWRNFEAQGSTFTSLNSGAYGYLYANEEGTELIYTGTINAYTSYKFRSASVATNPDSYAFPSWYLLGNSFMYDAYLAGASTNGNALPYIRMNEYGDGFENVAAGTPIEPMQGFFYEGVSGATSAYVVTYEPTVSSKAMLNMNLRKGNKQLDNAILVFGGNQQLGKMTFRANSSKIYMPVDGKDYAIATAESNMGEMPVSFKAENNGSYTLSFTSEEVSFAYLHLIDNMTGNDVNLLETPSYTFEAKTTDYASRFKLVFATGDNANDDNFAFFSNGSFVINNEGNATLQVVDITGRIVKSESINGCANVNVNAASGIYMLRLVNGDNVKVQKVVVK